MHTIHSQDAEGLDYKVLHRHLSQPVYRIRRYYLLLTDTEILVSFFTAFYIYWIVSYAGWGQVAPLGGPFTLDPWLMPFIGLGMAYGISFHHMAKPEARWDTFLRSGGIPRNFSPSMRDTRWKPSPVRSRFQKAELNTWT